MPIECTWFAEPPEGPWEPGWCFPLGYSLSRRYHEQDAGHRPAISVVVPIRDQPERGTPFCIDAHPSDDVAGHWTVTITGELVEGEKPDITVDPSIKAEGIFHGRLEHGTLTDDIGD